MEIKLWLTFADGIFLQCETKLEIHLSSQAASYLMIQIFL